jgi:hypothetical protein
LSWEGKDVRVSFVDEIECHLRLSIGVIQCSGIFDSATIFYRIFHLPVQSGERRFARARIIAGRRRRFTRVSIFLVDFVLRERELRLLRQHRNWREVTPIVGGSFCNRYSVIRRG